MCPCNISLGTENILLDLDADLSEIVTNQVPSQWKRIAYLASDQLDTFIIDFADRFRFLEVSFSNPLVDLLLFLIYVYFIGSSPRRRKTLLDIRFISDPDVSSWTFAGTFYKREHTHREFKAGADI